MLLGFFWKNPRWNLAPGADNGIGFTLASLTQLTSDPSPPPPLRGGQGPLLKNYVAL